MKNSTQAYFHVSHILRHMDLSICMRLQLFTCKYGWRAFVGTPIHMSTFNHANDEFHAKTRYRMQLQTCFVMKMNAGFRMNVLFYVG